MQPCSKQVQLVGSQDSKTIIPVYDWATFNKIPNIKQFHFGVLQRVCDQPRAVIYAVNGSSSTAFFVSPSPTILTA